METSKVETHGSLRDYGPAAPHGPNITEKHVATRDIHEMTNIGKGVFNFLLRPDDVYDSNDFRR